MRKNNSLKILMTIIITALITFSVTMLWLYGRKDNNDYASIFGNSLKADALSTKLNVIKEKIDSEYIGEIDENNMLEWAIKGYVAGLGDPYTEYFSKEEMEDYYSDTIGEFVGIGVYITKNEETNEIVIYDTIKNSPAQQAGIKAQDVLIEVGGKECNGDDFDTITNDIKGKEGTKVKIKVKRKSDENNEEIFEYEIERKNIEIVRVESQMLENNIGYIHISSFDGVKVPEQFEEEYDKLVNEGATSLIIDIRSNGGGIVDSATDIVDLFTDKGKELLIEKDKAGNEIIITSKRDRKINMNVALLVNEYSASASEILAGGFKDLVDNSTIIGKTTFGKGVIQGLYQLTDGSGLKLTIEEYLTPNRNSINGKGIEPDIVVDDYSYTGELDLENDTQLKKAIEVLK